MEQKKFAIVRKTYIRPIFIVPLDEVEGHKIYKRRYQAHIFVLHHKTLDCYFTIQYQGHSPFSHERLIEYIIDIKPALSMALN